MRSIGAAQYALDLMLQRVTNPAKKTFGKYLYEHGKPSRALQSSSFDLNLYLTSRHRDC